jgi:glycosyltransferase involved in cell wall biosynthesis
MRAVDAFAFSTPEEEELVRRRFAVTTPGAQIGIGIDLETPGRAADFRRRHGIEAPYLLCIGRMDANKGTSDLAVTFARYKTANPGSLRLVLIGDPVSPPDVHPDIDVLGVVDDTDKHDALDGCVALVSPSYFESFAMVITEAWAYRRPVLVQGANDVLLGHVSRSHGGLSYRSDDEFSGAVNSLLAESGRRGELGAAGRTHAEAVFGWDAVLGRYEQLLSSVVADGRSA